MDMIPAVYSCKGFDNYLLGTLLEESYEESLYLRGSGLQHRLRLQLGLHLPGFSQSKILCDRHGCYLSLPPHAARVKSLEELERVLIAYSLHYDARVSQCSSHIACGEE